VSVTTRAAKPDKPMGADESRKSENTTLDFSPYLVLLYLISLQAIMSLRQIGTMIPPTVAI
jgi:hypothetical protein